MSTKKRPETLARARRILMPDAASAAHRRFVHRAALATLMLGGLGANTAIAADEALSAEVNTFIGTKDDGNTYPGASAPFGQIQVSPIGSHYSGWRYDDPKIRGFGHSFISGAGCWEQGGLVSVLPITGTIGAGGTLDTSNPKSFDHKLYGADYTHEGEIGQAGYYKVRLTSYGGITAEATARTHAAAERYTFEGDAKTGHVLINVGQAAERHSIIGSTINVVGDRVVEGKLVSKSFCGGQQYTTWYRIEFDRPFRAFGTWDGDGANPDARHAMEGEAKPNGAWVSFDLGKDRGVTAISAISHVDAEGARNNLRSDGMQGGKLLGFEAMRKQAQAAWQKELSSVRVRGGGVDDRKVFYTALYHTLLQPLIGNDADGRYRGYDEQIHRADGWTYYEYFSLWDTYRSQNQWLALIRPQQSRDIARSLLAIDEQGGWLPRWGYANFDTNIMTGDPVTPFLVDLWRFGALQGREQAAYAALRKNAFGMPPLQSRHAGRSGNTNYLKEGFVQYDRAIPAKGMDLDTTHGGSATLEYALADCALSQMAGALGHADDAAVLRQRGGNWHRVWDAQARDESGFTGFPRPRMEGGGWYSPPRGDYSPRSQHGFHEGTAWQYQWLAQQDVDGLVEAMQGKDKALQRLDLFFAYDDLLADPQQGARKHWVVGPYSYYNQYRYNPNNEPDLHAPWMYTLIGAPWKTATVLRAAQHLFTNAPNGVTGNDDLGTMSAWYLFSSIGLYPAVPGTGQFLLNPPRFEQVELDLGNGKTLRIEAPGTDANRVQYVENVRYDDKSQPQVWVDWKRLEEGGTLRFDLTTTPPEQGWGTRAEALPSSPCSTRGTMP